MGTRVNNLSSFKYWPNQQLAKKLSSEGHVVINDKKTQCLYCGVEINWTNENVDSLALHEKVSPYCDIFLKEQNKYASLQERLKTFQNWNGKNCAEELAKNNFIFIGRKDRTKCISCFCTLEEWEVGDNIYLEHKKFSPNCPFVKSFETSNGFVNAEFLCVICLENNKNIFLHPCGHVPCCVKCAAQLNKCPLCQIDIKKRCVAYL